MKAFISVNSELWAIPWAADSILVRKGRPELIFYLGGLLTIAGTWLVSYKRGGEAKWRAIDLMVSLGRRHAGLGIAKYPQSRA